jgi:CRISPR type I-E-associated protein CasB/Cse2
MTFEAAATVAAPAAPAARAAVSRRDAVATMAAMLRSGATSTGQRARLRRADPSLGSRDALLEAELLFAGAGLAPRAEEHARWFLVLHCLALAEGRHAPGVEAGAVLARLRFGEGRLRQLVEADEQTLVELLPRIARRVATAGASMNWWPLADLVLGAGGAHPEDIARANRARQQIVRQYLHNISSVQGDTES